MRLGFVAGAWLYALLLLFSNTSLAAQQTVPGPTPGVAVLHVNPESSAAKAGLRAGDRILAWSRSGPRQDTPSGVFTSILDWQTALWTQAHRGPARLRVRRGGSEIMLEIDTSWLGAETSPVLNAEASRAYSRGRQALARHEPPEAWELAAKRLQASGDWTGAWWLSTQLASARARLGKHAGAQQSHRAALALARAKLDAGAQAISLTRWGRYLWKQDRVAEAKPILREAVVLWRQTDPHGIGAAQAEIDLAATSNYEVDLNSAEASLRRTLEHLTRSVPDSLPIALAERQLGTLEWTRGAYQAAEDHFLAGLRVMERLDPRAEQTCWIIYLLGGMFAEYPDIDKAGKYLKRALKITEETFRDPYLLGVIHNALGSIAMDQGKHALASEHLLHALDLFEQVAPGKLIAANPLINLSVVADERMELDKAEHYSRQTLEITRSNGPQSDSHAIGLINLGYTLLQKGDVKQAENYLMEASALKVVEVDPRLSWANKFMLGEIALKRGQYDLAQSHLQNALAISVMRDLQPMLFFGLAEVAIARHDYKQAQGYYQHSLDIATSLAPGSRRQAEALYGLARVSRASAKLEQAAAYMKKAIAALESQIGKLGATEEIRSQFRASFHHYYREYIDLLLELNQPDQAYHILERSRARQFTEMLALRELDFQELPEHLNANLKQNATQYDETQARLAGLDADKQTAKRDTLIRRLDELRAQRDEIVEQVRLSSPRLAGLTHPSPLTLKQVQNALQPETILIAYSTSREKLHIFAVSRDKLHVHSQSVGEDTIRAKVNGFRARIALGRDAPLDPATRKRARELYDLLLAPIETQIAPRKRMVLLPDGPLHHLPYAALLKDDKYLISWKPMLTVLSGSVYAELKSRTPIKETSLIGFGDPDYQRNAHAGPMYSVAGVDANFRGVEEGYFKPLPASRLEVEHLKKLFADQAEVFVGNQANEKRAKSLTGETRYLHFATHAVLNENFPLDSGLVLAPPLKTDTDNGILQAWEIIEQLRLEADMVTLSACETALGKERNGEGLLGLSRAFLHAGARSVLASLWKVEDESTAEFMRYVYRELRDGKPKAEALRAAQLAMIESDGGKHAANPYHWAGFQLIGLGD